MHRMLLPITALVFLFAMALLAAPQASAQSPHPGLNFYLSIDTDGDGVDDCDTNGGPTTCYVRQASIFDVNVYLGPPLPDDIPSYLSFETLLQNNGVSAKGRSTHWPDGLCIVEDAEVRPEGPIGVGCEVMPGAFPSTHTGLIAAGIYSCVADGEVTLTRASVDSFDLNGESHYQDGSADVLDIRCVLPGDVNCDDNMSSMDALLILQFHAGLLSGLPCLVAADVNKDGHVNSIDAFFVIKYHAGPILHSLPRVVSGP